MNDKEKTLFPSQIPTYLNKTNVNGLFKHKKSNVVINGNLDEYRAYVNSKKRSEEMRALTDKLHNLETMVKRLLEKDKGMNG